MTVVLSPTVSVALATHWQYNNGVQAYQQDGLFLLHATFQTSQMKTNARKTFEKLVF